tara:strand:+ start:1243 stop:2160 length:918 start_codon:yes stop_codon:yes gene_type:complete
MDKNEVDHIIKILPEKITVKSAQRLYEQSNWDLESCRYFTFKLKNGIVNYFKNYNMENFGIVYLPDLALMGITRTAPMGSKRQKKNLEKIINEMGSYNVDKDYKDVFEQFVSYLSMSIFTYYMQGQTSFLNGLADPKYFITSLQMSLELIFNVNEDIEEGEELWDPYKVQDLIVKNIQIDNDNLDKTEEDYEKNIQSIPRKFNILKDVNKLSPLKISINSKFVKESDVVDKKKNNSKKVKKTVNKNEDIDSDIEALEAELEDMKKKKIEAEKKRKEEETKKAAELKKLTEDLDKLKEEIKDLEKN